MTSRSPTVSIGVPVYNGADYLREALDSILAQTFDDIEVIISDTAYNDDTQSISLEYVTKDSRVRYERNETNLGPHGSTTSPRDSPGASTSSGRLTTNRLAPTFLERCVERLESSDAIALVYLCTILGCEDPTEREFYGGHHVRYGIGWTAVTQIPFVESVTLRNTWTYATP